MKRQKEISLTKKYILPEFRVVKHRNLYIAIAENLAKWVILKNDAQLDVLKQLSRGAEIEKVLSNENCTMDDLRQVLVQIEAKGLEDCTVQSIFSNTRLHLHLTNLCNLRCSHCYMNSGTRCDNELSGEEIEKLLLDFVKFGGTDLSLTGGEPTMRSDFYHIVRYASDLGLCVSIYSNGCLIDEDAIQRLKGCNIGAFQISIDGYDETSNSIIRGRGSFEKSLRAVDLLVNAGIKVKIAMTPALEYLRTQKENYIQFAKEVLDKYGRDNVEYNFTYEFMPGRNLSADKIAIIKEEYYNAINEIVTGIYGDTTEATFSDNLLDDHIFDSCGFGGLNITSDGDVYFCDRLPDVAKICNVREIAFEKIFKMAKNAEKAANIKNFSPCRECVLKYICGGGCRVENFIGFGQIRDFSRIDYTTIAPKMCTPADKERIFDLMVKTNERFYK